MNDTRWFWLDSLTKIVRPVLENLSEGRLAAAMPVEHHPDSLDRREYTYLEAFGRAMTGLAPWLAHPAEDADEEKARVDWCALARKALRMAVDPASPDCMNFERGQQPIVDAAFLAQAILRAPEELWDKLDGETQRLLVEKMKRTRTRKPSFNNWLLFSATIEAFLRRAGEADWDPMRIDYALRQHEQWYAGDGVYCDGPRFHWDYYNSFVIQPMLLDVLNAASDFSPDWQKMRAPMMRRAARYAAVLEQLINADGSYPIVGRSSCYRFGAFQSLAQAALLDARAGAGALRADGGDSARDELSINVRRKRLADARRVRPSAGYGRVLYLDRQPVSLLGGVPAAGASRIASVLGGRGLPVDGEAALGRRKRIVRSRAVRLSAA